MPPSRPPDERAAELGIDPPHVLAVTLLTSIAPEDLNELGFQGGPGENAIRLAALARDAGCSGVICSAHEVRDLKRFFGEDFLTLTPGIRPSGTAHSDQKRVTTPAAAVEAARTISSLDDRSLKRPIRWRLPKPSSRKCPYEHERHVTRPAKRARAAWRFLEGHFRLSSGRHSDRFVQKFRILEDPALLERVGRALADRFRMLKPTVVVGAAVGAILLAYEVARQLGTKAIFVEKENGVPSCDAASPSRRKTEYCWSRMY